MTRLAVIDDERGLILGKDNDGIFEKGVVYALVKIMDEIIIRPVGHYALDHEHMFPNQYADVNTMVVDPNHLFTYEELQRWDEFQKEAREKKI